MFVIFSTILLYLSQVSNKVLCNQHLHFGCTVSNSDFLWYSFLATENQWCAHCTLVFTKQQVSNHHLLSNTLLYKDRWYVLCSMYYIFCFQNCWEKIALVIEKNFWNSRMKAENLQNFEITRTIYSNSERSEQFR